MDIVAEAAREPADRRPPPPRDRRRARRLVHDPGHRAPAHPRGRVRAGWLAADRRRVSDVAAGAHAGPGTGGSARPSGRAHAPLRGLRAGAPARVPDGGALMALPRTALADLRRIAGDRHVIDDANDLRIFERDGSISGALPEAVVLPADRDEVVRVVQVAARHGIPVVPRAAGTGLSGGAITLWGGIALQLSRMRRIVEIDPIARTAVVEPGVVNADLQQAAGRLGLFYAPDPSSQKACTIGGNAAENS